MGHGVVKNFEVNVAKNMITTEKTDGENCFEIRPFITQLTSHENFSHSKYK